VNRPLLWAAVAFAAGVWLAGLNNTPLVWIATSACALLLLNRWPHPLPYRDGFLVALVFLVLGAGLESAQRPQRYGDPLAVYVRLHPETVFRLEGKVTEAAIYVPGMDYMAVRLRADRVWASGQETSLAGGVVVRWSNPDTAVHPGERVRLEGQLDSVLGEVNMGIRGVEDFYRTHGYHSVLRVRGNAVTRLSSPTLAPRYWASHLRQWQASVFSRAAPEDVRPFLRAVWLGDRTGLTDEAYRPYLETGTAHILAVSGVHVGIVFMSLQWILRYLVESRKRRAIVIMVAVLIFALVTGARAPILRASLMVCLYLCAELLDREPDAPTALSIAALLFLIYNPGLVRDTGFALSFTSLASILVFSEALNERMTALPQGIRQNVAAAVGVSVLPLPLGAHLFHVIPIIGPMCNLLVIPLLTAILWLCILTVTTAVFSVQVASLFGHAVAPLVAGIALITRHATNFPWASAYVTSPAPLAWFSYGAAALCLAQWLYRRPHSGRWLAGAALSLLGTWVFWQPLHAPATLDFLDVAHGDATFVRTPGGTTLLVDAGDKSDYADMGSRVVVPWLLANGVDRLDYLVVTHADRDHIGGVKSVLERVKTGAVLLWPEATANPLEQELLAQCETLSVPVQRMQAGETVPALGSTITVLHPTPGAFQPGSNNDSVVLRVVWPGMDALLTGDIEVEAERALGESLSRTAVLKSPHHGSHTSSSAPFLDAVDPALAVVSTRRTANRQATGEGVMSRYEERGIAIYRTDFQGGIQVRVERGAIQVRSARGTRGYTLDPNGQ